MLPVDQSRAVFFFTYFKKVEFQLSFTLFEIQTMPMVHVVHKVLE